MVELTVKSLNASRRWYETLGLTFEKHDAPNRFVSLKDAQGRRLALKEGEPKPGTVLVYFEVAELPAAAAVKTSEEGYSRVILTDPDGYKIGLYSILGSSAE